MSSKPKWLPEFRFGVSTWLRTMASIVSRGGESLLSRRGKAGGQCEQQPRGVMTLFVLYILRLHRSLELFGGKVASILLVEYHYR